MAHCSKIAGSTICVISRCSSALQLMIIYYHMLKQTIWLQLGNNLIWNQRRRDSNPDLQLNFKGCSCRPLSSSKANGSGTGQSFSFILNVHILSPLPVCSILNSFLHANQPCFNLLTNPNFSFICCLEIRKELFDRF